ncbi:jg5707 [Pararge aegeria aegeria]|uniref:Jg5707 protein n=1 Tax=Pararge aegeria aegeria TaxID=348720 RepID=A0A8S4SFH7_9NEOP|nr:jg5707 [Pararge aegeria aegeria]
MMLCVWWDWKGINHELLPPGRIIDSELYCEQLMRLKQEVERKRLELINRRGAQISNNGGCIDENKRRMAMSRSAMDKLQRIWKNRNITKATKIRLVKALIFPIFFYASETWTLRETEKKIIDALEMWCWRRMLGVTWNMFRTNESILDELSIKQRLSSAVQVRILSFFGHVSRRNDVSIERLVVQGKVEGQSTRKITDEMDGPSEGYNPGSST